MSGKYCSINPNMLHVVTQVMISFNYLFMHIIEDARRRIITYGTILECSYFNKTMFSIK